MFWRRFRLRKIFFIQVWRNTWRPWWASQWTGWRWQAWSTTHSRARRSGAGSNTETTFLTRVKRPQTAPSSCRAHTLERPKNRPKNSSKTPRYAILFFGISQSFCPEWSQNQTVFKHFYTKNSSALKRDHSVPAHFLCNFSFTTLWLVQIIKAGGAGYKSMSLFHGLAELYFHSGIIKKWDLAAAEGIIKSTCYGRFTTLDGRTIDYRYNSIFLTFFQFFVDKNANFYKTWTKNGKTGIAAFIFVDYFFTKHFSAKADHVNRGGVLASLHHHERYLAQYRSVQSHEL